MLSTSARSHHPTRAQSPSPHRLKAIESEASSLHQGTQPVGSTQSPCVGARIEHLSNLRADDNRDERSVRAGFVPKLHASRSCARNRFLGVGKRSHIKPLC